jgi:hypothetical protein
MPLIGSQTPLNDLLAFGNEKVFPGQERRFGWSRPAARNGIKSAASRLSEAAKPVDTCPSCHPDGQHFIPAPLLKRSKSSARIIPDHQAGKIHKLAAFFGGLSRKFRRCQRAVVPCALACRLLAW